MGRRWRQVFRRRPAGLRHLGRDRIGLGLRRHRRRLARWCCSRHHSAFLQERMPAGSDGHPSSLDQWLFVPILLLTGLLARLLVGLLVLTLLLLALLALALLLVTLLLGLLWLAVLRIVHC